MIGDKMKDKTLNEIKKLETKYSNNMELGKKVREFIRHKNDEWRIKQFNRNRDSEEQVSTIEEMEKKVDEIFNS
tara:strand:- start:46 stop:267 length:222 start_codon:yes stop_codon:yes gene_type:complete